MQMKEFGMQEEKARMDVRLTGKKCHFSQIAKQAFLQKKAIPDSKIEKVLIFSTVYHAV